MDSLSRLVRPPGASLSSRETEVTTKHHLLKVTDSHFKVGSFEDQPRDSTVYLTGIQDFYVHHGKPEPHHRPCGDISDRNTTTTDSDQSKTFILFQEENTPPSRDTFYLLH